MNKKGAINLAIQLIVIIVIAVVILGLGVGFVRNMFDDVGDLTESIQGEIKEKILDDLRTGDKKLSFSNTEINIGKKEAKVIALGIKNIKQGTLKYKVLIEEKGGDLIFGEDINNSFLYLEETEELGPTETRVIPVRITTETASGTGQFKLSILDVTDGEPGEVYDSKTFFITVIG